MSIAMMRLEAQDIVFKAIAARLDYDSYLAYAHEIGQASCVVKKSAFPVFESKYYKSVDIVNTYITNQRKLG